MVRRVARIWRVSQRGDWVLVCITFSGNTVHGVQDVRHEDLVLVCIEQTQFCIPHGKACALDLCVVEDKNPEALGHMKAGIVRGGPPG